MAENDMREMMKKHTVFWLLLGFIISFWNCTPSNEGNNIRKFYYPVEDLKEGKIYEYQAVGNDSLPVKYWYYVSLETDTGLYLVSNYYDHAFINQQLVVEFIDDDGAYATQYKFMSIDPDQQGSSVVDVDVVDNYTFPFFADEYSGVFPMELRFQDPQDPDEEIRLVRERKFLKDTLYTYQGKDLNAILMSANEIRKFTHSEKGDFDQVTVAYEVYAENIGMISRWYDLGSQRIEYALKDIYGMPEFEKMAAEYWGQDVDMSPFK